MDDTVLVIRDVLNEEELKELRGECERCLATMHLSEDELYSRSCALDFFEDSTIPDRSNVRNERVAYLAERWRERASSPDIRGRSVIENLLFCKLPGILLSVLGVTRSFLFNEHYIVKPAHSDMAFGWHIDEEKQLGFLSPEDKYTTLWCALDDMTVQNGTLIVDNAAELVHTSLLLLGETGDSRPAKRARVEKKRIVCGDVGSCVNGSPLEVKAGTVVLFSSKMQHCSGPNGSGEARRVFYVQYSASPIGLSLAEPLNFAVETKPDKSYSFAF